MTRVRLASVRDYPFCADLSEQAMRLHLEGRPDLFSAPLSPALSRPGFEGMLQNPDFLLLVAEEAGAVRGFLIARRQANKAFCQEELFVESLVVDAAHRGRGLGRALMDSLELEARRRGYASLALQVWEFNQAAQAFMPAAVIAPAPISWKSSCRPTAHFPPCGFFHAPFLPPFRARCGPWAVFLDAAHRGRGLGRALMDFLELEARRRGYASLALQVWEFNHAAQAFYARGGYRPRSHILEKPL